jgi:diguanylate cyclase (GGDEF)-like protein
MNHRRFLESLNIEVRRSLRNMRPLSLLLVDIDFFHLYNQNYGQEIGDECLKKIAKSLTEIVKRPTDLIARFGGEEFTILLSETDTNGAMQVAQKIQSGISAMMINHKDSPVSPWLTVSIGYVSLIPKSPSDAEILLQLADNALFSAKKTGRNCIVASNHQ